MTYIKEHRPTPLNELKRGEIFEYGSGLPIEMLYIKLGDTEITNLGCSLGIFDEVSHDAPVYKVYIRYQVNSKRPH